MVPDVTGTNQNVEHLLAACTKQQKNVAVKATQNETNHMKGNLEQGFIYIKITVSLKPYRTLLGTNGL